MEFKKITTKSKSYGLNSTVDGKNSFRDEMQKFYSEGDFSEITNVNFHDPNFYKDLEGDKKFHESKS
jgi:hypothetical protein